MKRLVLTGITLSCCTLFGCSKTPTTTADKAVGVAIETQAEPETDPDSDNGEAESKTQTVTVTMTARSEDLKRSDYREMTDEELRNFLTPMQYQVTQEDGTEPRGCEYDKLYEDGIYVDIVSGQPLFSSKDKFDSGTGWPSFVKPLSKEAVTEHTDTKFFMTRTEVRSSKSDSHLGHVFPDGPAPTGMRYCMNSASLRFIPKDKLEELGYGEFVKLFEDKAEEAE